MIGHYEGVKGVRMPFSEKVLEMMGIDGGGSGGTSGGYDQLGYSVLMNTRDGLAQPHQIPTELKGHIEVDGKLMKQSDLGGLTNTYTKNYTTSAASKGKTVKLLPQLPEGEENTGKWLWNTGETTQDITVITDRSYIYRVTYTNKQGVQSQQCFSIAVENDNTPTRIVPAVTYEGKTTEGICTVDVIYGQTVTLSATPLCGWGTGRWSSGQTTESITTPSIRKPQDYTYSYTNQSKTVSNCTFHVNVVPARPWIQISGGTVRTTQCVVEAGGCVTLGLDKPAVVGADKIEWTGGFRGDKIELTDLQTSGTYTATFTLAGETVTFEFTVFVKSPAPTTVDPGNYVIQHIGNGRLLTAHGKNQSVTFEEGSADAPVDGQVWFIDNKNTRHNLVSLPDSLSLTTAAKLSAVSFYSFYIEQPLGADPFVLRTGTSSGSFKYWNVEADGSVSVNHTKLTDYPFLLIPVDKTDGIKPVENGNGACPARDAEVYDLAGRRVQGMPIPGIYIVNGKKVIIK